MFKKLIFLLIPFFVILYSIEISFGGYGDGKAKGKTFTGILIDTKCYGMSEDNITNDHMAMKQCATMCAKMGIPVGLLIDGKKGGKVIVVTIPAPALAEHMGKWARITGEIKFKHGLVPEKIEVKNGDIYEEVDIKTMM